MSSWQQAPWPVRWLAASDVQDVPAHRGTYLLLFDLARPLSLTVGHLGMITLAAGGLVYAGSAFGPGGLRARLARHVAGPRHRHWHVDSLSATCPPVALAYAEGPERLECRWIRHILAAGAQVPAPGFGSSDCREGCPAHLLWMPSIR